MSGSAPDSAKFARAFCTRVRALRIERHMTRDEIARALGVTRAAYVKYETRTPLPHHLIEPFAALTGLRSTDQLFERTQCCDEAPAS